MTMRVIKLLLQLATLAAVLMPAYAVDIYVAQGQDKAFPIAVAAFEGAAEGKQLARDIRADLRHSPRFEVMTANDMSSGARQVDPVNWQAWQRSQAEYALVGSLTPVGGNDHYNVSVKLVSTGAQHVLLGKEFMKVAPGEFSHLGHHIADLVYQSLTGRQGYFSTKLAYVAVENLYQREKTRYKLVVADYDGSHPFVVRSQRQPLSSPAWSPHGRKLAYVSYENGRMAIYTINIHSGERQLISNAPGINSAPAFDPRGGVLLAALSPADSIRTNLYTIDLESNRKLAKLTAVGINTAPTYSPDGNKIAFTSNKGGSPQLYSMNRDGSMVRRLTYEGRENYEAQFAAGGERIVFMHSGEHCTGTCIVGMALDSHHITPLTDGPADKSPTVSPNGRMMVYSRSEGQGRSLRMISLEGRREQAVPAITTEVRSPAWSPFLGQ